jgi:hypothetical protein
MTVRHLMPRSSITLATPRVLISSPLGMSLMLEGSFVVVALLPFGQLSGRWFHDEYLSFTHFINPSPPPSPPSFSSSNRRLALCLPPTLSRKEKLTFMRLHQLTQEIDLLTDELYVMDVSSFCDDTLYFVFEVTICSLLTYCSLLPLPDLRISSGSPLFASLETNGSSKTLSILFTNLFLA